MQSQRGLVIHDCALYSARLAAGGLRVGECCYRVLLIAGRNPLLLTLVLEIAPGERRVVFFKPSGPPPCLNKRCRDAVEDDLCVLTEKRCKLQ